LIHLFIQFADKNTKKIQLFLRPAGNLTYFGTPFHLTAIPDYLFPVQQRSKFNDKTPAGISSMHHKPKE